MLYLYIYRYILYLNLIVLNSMFHYNLSKISSPFSISMKVLIYSIDEMKLNI